MGSNARKVVVVRDGLDGVLCCVSPARVAGSSFTFAEHPIQPSPVTGANDNYPALGASTCVKKRYQPAAGQTAPP